MKYFLTGACGFIGSNLALSLLERGHEVLNLDNLTYAANQKGFEKYKNYQLIVYDVSKLQNKDDISKSVKYRIQEFKPDYVVHLASESMVDKSLINDEIFLESNVKGTWALLTLLKEMPVKKAVFFSTDEVYGSFEDGIETDNVAFGFKEIDKTNPKNPYAGTKASADQLTIAYTSNYKLPICIIRPSNNYGSRQNEEKFIPKCITNTLQGKPIPVYGKGDCYFREWLHVEETCRAVELLLEKGKPEVYNVGSGKRCHNLEVINLIGKILEVTPNIIHVTDRVNHDVAYAVNSEKIRQLGWTSNIDLTTGLADTIKYYSDGR